MAEEKNIPKIPKPPLPQNKPTSNIPPKPPSGSIRPNVPLKPQPYVEKPVSGGNIPGTVFSQPAVQPPQFSSSIEQRLWEAEQAKRQMEQQLVELQRMLLEEREKLMMQTIKTKEEETLATKVEESIRDIQERLRKEKREQELLEEKEKLLKQIKELEERLAKERETWVETLKTQLSQRDVQEQQIEQQYLSKIHDLETRWQEEKYKFQTMLKKKEDEVARIKNEYKVLEDKLKADLEKQISEYKFQYKTFENEIKHLKEIIEQKDKEILSVKTQLSTVESEAAISKERLEFEIKKRDEQISKLQNFVENLRTDLRVIKETKEQREKEFFYVKSTSWYSSSKT